MKLKALLLSSIILTTHNGWAMDPMPSEDQMPSEIESLRQLLLSISPDGRNLLGSGYDSYEELDQDNFSAICSFNRDDLQSPGSILDALNKKIKEISDLVVRNFPEEEAHNVIESKKEDLACALGDCSGSCRLNYRRLDEVVDSLGLTVLNLALTRRNFECAKLLLIAAGNRRQDWLDYQDPMGKTALGWAIYSHSKDMVKLLLDSSDNKIKQLLMPQNNRGHCSLHLVASTGNLEMVQLLLVAAGKYIKTLLVQYSKDGYPIDMARTPEAYNFLQAVQAALEVGDDARVQELLTIQPEETNETQSTAS